MRIQSALIGLALFAALATSAAVAGTATFRGDAAHSGVYDGAGVATLHGVKWKFATKGQVISSPAIADGTVFVGSTDGKLYAVDQASGAQRWAFETKVRNRFPT